MDFELSAEQAAFRDTIRDFVRREVSPVAREMEHQEVYPAEIVARMAEAGEAPLPDLLAHVSPLGWEHITLTGEYRWPRLSLT